MVASVDRSDQRPHQMHGHEKHMKSYFLFDDDAQLLPVGDVER
jgi:hypothetical protein